jgi:hypothetical protein
MATLNKFDDFSEKLANGTHDFVNHIFRIALTNTSPIAANTSLSDITEITGINGYNTGGTATTVTVTEVGGVTTVSGTPVVFTASGGPIDTFRYYVLYNDSAPSPTNALVCWFDHGTVVNLADSETFTIRFNNVNGSGAIFTIV